MSASDTPGLMKAVNWSVTSWPAARSVAEIGWISDAGIFIFCVSTNSASQKPPVQLLFACRRAGSGWPGSAAVLLKRPIFGFGST